MDDRDRKELVRQAFLAQQQAYAPYSEFLVGAALLTEGRRDFTAIAIVGNKRGEAGDYCPPCGVCRQVMAEFCKADFEILLAKDTENWKSYTLEQLLPERFTL